MAEDDSLVERRMAMQRRVLDGLGIIAPSQSAHEAVLRVLADEWFVELHSVAVPLAERIDAFLLAKGHLL